MNGDTMLVGSAAGAAYVFVRSGNSWAQEAKLTASDGFTGDGYSNSVAVDGDIAIVGASYANGQSGAAYIHVRSGGQWTEEQKLLPLDPSIGDRCGSFVAIDGDRIAIASLRNDELGSDYGSVYVFRLQAGSWIQT